MKGLIALAVLLLPLAEAARSHAEGDLPQSYEKGKTLVQDMKKSGESKGSWTSDEQEPLTASRQISVSDLLKGASIESKLEFLESLILVDGKVASLRIDALRAEIGEARAQKVVAAINPDPKPAYKISETTHALGLCNESQCDDAACRNKNCVDMKGHLCFSSCK